MKLPASVRVGYRDYAIEAWPASHAHASSRYGECDTLNGVIRVMDGLPGLVTAEILLHEVFHAAWEAGCLDDKDDQERTVGVLSKVFVQVWRGNPALRECLMLAV